MVTKPRVAGITALLLLVLGPMSLWWDIFAIRRWAKESVQSMRSDEHLVRRIEGQLRKGLRPPKGLIQLEAKEHAMKLEIAALKSQLDRHKSALFMARKTLSDGGQTLFVADQRYSRSELAKDAEQRLNWVERGTQKLASKRRALRQLQTNRASLTRSHEKYVKSWQDRRDKLDQLKVRLNAAKSQKEIAQLNQEADAWLINDNQLAADLNEFDSRVRHAEQMAQLAETGGLSGDELIEYGETPTLSIIDRITRTIGPDESIPACEPEIEMAMSNDQ